MHTRERIFYLLNQYTSDTITTEEKNELFYIISLEENTSLIEEYFNANLDKESAVQDKIAPQKAEEIFRKIIDAEKYPSYKIPTIFAKKLIYKWTIAASIMALLVLSTVVFFKTNKPGEAPIASVKPLNNLLERKNVTDHPIKLKLEDSSIVTLEPGASIKYPSHFETAKREVYMDGEIFFKIAKNPNRPFFVYNNDIITRVLGTSFNIKIDRLSKQVEVAVVTGRVQVYENDKVASLNGKPHTGVILTPNQKVVFNKTKRNFSTSLVSNPKPIITDDSLLKPHSFVFNETPLYTVLNSIQKLYGIEIDVQNKSINNFLFNGNITNYDLYAKLDIICESTKTSYEIIGTKILIKAKN